MGNHFWESQNHRHSRGFMALLGLCLCISLGTHSCLAFIRLADRIGPAPLI